MDGENFKKIKVVQEPKKTKKMEESDIIEENNSKDQESSSSEDNWLQSAGQLAVDAYETDEEIVVQAPIAGIKADDLDISIENDMLIIKGYREKPPESSQEKTYFYEECFWGPFIRKIILSDEVDSSRAEANLKEGVFTLRIPKIERNGKKRITVEE